jgi:hypothetical protein
MLHHKQITRPVLEQLCPQIATHVAMAIVCMLACATARAQIHHIGRMNTEQISPAGVPLGSG